MWNFTTDGMTSVVLKNGKFQVRARDRASLEALYSSDRIVTGAGTDYPFRVYSTHEEYATAMYNYIMSIDYSNFKDAAKAKRHDTGDKYASVLSRVWYELLSIEPANVLELLNKSTSFRIPTKRKRGKRGKGSRGRGTGYVTPLLEIGEDAWSGYDEWETERHSKEMAELAAEYPHLLKISEMTDEEWESFENTI